MEKFLGLSCRGSGMGSVVLGLLLGLGCLEVSAAPHQACTAPDYKAGTAYQQGDQVQNVGRQFECWKDAEAPNGPDSWKWCEQVHYNPGAPAENGAEYWPDAWKDLGECGGFQGNRLTLSFATLSGRAPLKNRCQVYHAPTRW